MNAHHDMGYYTHTCLKCGLTAEQLQTSASPWCDYLEPTGHSNLATLAHIIAIIFFIGAPLYAMMMPAGPFTQIAFVVVITTLAGHVALIHAGMWDWLLTGETE
jgi:hypothetical protein